jgi:hypothetical protein
MSNIFQDYHKRDDSTLQKDREYSRILTAAVVNEKFRRLLLSDPAQALKVGFGGEAFHLAADEKRRISRIQVKTLAEFAKQMNILASRPSLTLPV